MEISNFNGTLKNILMIFKSVESFYENQMLNFNFFFSQCASKLSNFDFFAKTRYLYFELNGKCVW